MTPKLRADLLLLLAAAIWGLAFVAQRLGMEHVGPLTFNGIRFALGALILIPFVAARGRAARRDPDAAQPAAWADDLRRAAVLGGVLFAGATLQQWGIVTTTAGKAGFITGLYVVLTPIFGLLVGQRTALGTWLGTGLAAVGLYFLTVTESLTIGLGDLLVLFGAVFWAAHVVLIGRYSPRTEPVRLACLQFAVVSGLSLAGALALETIAWSGVRAAAGPILYAGFLSTGVAYTLQVVAQRRAPAAHAAIILSLEAVFAVLGGIVLLGETLAVRALVGCALMLAGMILSQVGPGARRAAGD